MQSDYEDSAVASRAKRWCCWPTTLCAASREPFRAWIDHMGPAASQAVMTLVIKARCDESPRPTSSDGRSVRRVARWLAHVPGALLLRVVGESPRVSDGATLDAHLQFLLAVRRIKGEPAMCEPTLAEGRLRYRHEVLTVTGAPTPVARVTACQVPGAAGPLDARHYAPESSPKAPLLVYLHGGGSRYQQRWVPIDDDWAWQVILDRLAYLKGVSDVLCKGFLE